VASHDEVASWKKEHGDFAGIGFFQDLTTVQSLAMNASLSERLVFIGHRKRSSSVDDDIHVIEKMKGCLFPCCCCKQTHHRPNRMHTTFDMPNGPFTVA
jgi:hypothetical protein